MSVAAVIVTFEPALPRLLRLLETVSTQVDYIFVVDNSSDAGAEKIDQLQPVLAQARWEVRHLGENAGIASAQNVGIAMARQAQCKQLVFFDQDSQPPPDLVPGLLAAQDRLLKEDVKVGALGPRFVDEKSGKRSTAKQVPALAAYKSRSVSAQGECEPTDYLISSGSLISMATLDAVGLMREELFIDWVDIEWCLRARNSGFRCYLVPQLEMMHSVGDSFVRILGRSVDLHTDVRNYYLVRNALYLARDRALPLGWRLKVLASVPAFVAVYSYCTLSRERLKALGLLLRACADGLRGRMGRAF